MRYKKTNTVATTEQLAERFDAKLSEIANAEIHVDDDGEWRWKSLDRNWRFYLSTPE